MQWRQVIWVNLKKLTVIQDHIKFCKISYHINIGTYLFDIHRVCSFQAHIFISTTSEISWSVLGYFGTFGFSVFLFCHVFGGRETPKQKNIHEVTVDSQFDFQTKSLEPKKSYLSIIYKKNCPCRIVVLSPTSKTRS